MALLMALGEGEDMGGEGEDMGGDDEGEIVIRTYYMKKSIFN